ncbi:hypothetical protein CC78DRAFT_612270, partial [Lojkania enalia]
VRSAARASSAVVISEGRRGRKQACSRPVPACPSLSCPSPSRPSPSRPSLPERLRAIGRPWGGKPQPYPPTIAIRRVHRHRTPHPHPLPLAPSYQPPPELATIQSSRDTFLSFPFRFSVNAREPILCKQYLARPLSCLDLVLGCASEPPCKVLLAVWRPVLVHGHSFDYYHCQYAL